MTCSSGKRYITLTDGRLWVVSEQLYQKILTLQRTKPPEMDEPLPPITVFEWVCGDCGIEQAFDRRCLKCGSLRLALISVVEKHFGKDWKQRCFGDLKKVDKK
jgi:hypothetical protein